MIKRLLALVGIKPSPIYRVRVIHFAEKYYEIEVKLPVNFFWQTVYSATYNEVEGAVWCPELVTAYNSDEFIKNNISTVEAYNNYINAQWKTYLSYKVKYKKFLHEEAPFESKDII